LHTFQKRFFFFNQIFINCNPFNIFFSRIPLQSSSEHTIFYSNYGPVLYQPIDSVILFLASTRSSNIVEDHDTISLLARFVSEIFFFFFFFSYYFYIIFYLLLLFIIIYYYYLLLLFIIIGYYCDLG
jgi:hypothetical protein